MAKKYPLEEALEKGSTRILKELVLWIKMIKKFFFTPPKAKEWWQYCFTRGMWLLWIVSIVYAVWG